MLDRQPPYDLDAERALLGSILLDPRVCDHVAPILKAGEFFDDANRRLYVQILALYDEKRTVDVTMLVDRLRQNGDFEVVGGAAYLYRVAQTVPNAAHAVYYANILVEKARRRAVIQAATDMLADAYDDAAPIDEVIAECEVRLQNVPTGEFAGEPVELVQAVMAACDRVDEIFQRKRAAGTMIGLPSFDMAAGGVFPGELVLLAARPSVGKTALALQVAEHVASKGKVVYFASLEMRSTELAMRLLCGQSGVPLARVRSADLTVLDTVEFSSAAKAVSPLPIWLHDRPGLSVQDVRRACRRLASKAELSLVVVDYVQRVTPADRRAPRHLQVGQVSWDLKALALELGVPILALTQLSRQAEERDKNTGLVREPRLSDLKETGDLEQDADMVLLLHRQARAYDAKMILAKNRQGEQGSFHLVFDAQKMLFTCCGHGPIASPEPEEFNEEEF